MTTAVERPEADVPSESQGDATRREAPPRATHGRWRRLVYLLAIVGILGPIFLSRATFLVLPPQPDQGLYVTIGEMIDRGAVPWRDAWDNKPPAIYYLYAGVMKLAPDYSQDCGVPGRPIIHVQDGFHVSCAQYPLTLVDALIALATAAAVWWIGARLFGWAAGAAAGVLCAIFASMFQVAQGGGLPDTDALLPVSLAFAAAVLYADSRRARWLVAAGVFAALGALFKQTSALAFFAIAGWLIAVEWRGPTRRSLALRLGQLTAGALAVGLVTLGIVAWLGALPQMIDETILWNFTYVAGPPPGQSFFPLALRQTFKVFTDSQAGLWLAAVGGLLLLPSATKRDSRVGLIAAWAVASAVGIVLGNARFNQYYYVALVPPLAVCGAWALVQLWQSSQRAGRVWLSVTALALLVFSGELQAHYFQEAWYSRVTSTTWSPEEYVGGSLRGNTAPLFIWGNAAEVYAMSGRIPATPYLQTLALSNDFGRNPRMQEQRAILMRDLQAKPPQIIAIDTPWLKAQSTTAFPELQQFIQAHYTLDNDPKNPIMAGWEVYRKTSS